MCQGTGSVRSTLPSGDDAGEFRHFAAALRAHGYAVTAQRAAIARAMLGAPGHICAEHLLEAVQSAQPRLRVNKTTVYRTLDLFLSLGLIAEMKCAEERTQYEVAAPAPHFHMVCERCGAVQGLAPELAEGLRAALLERYGFQARLDTYPLSGLCRTCGGRGGDLTDAHP